MPPFNFANGLEKVFNLKELYFFNRFFFLFALFVVLLLPKSVKARVLDYNHKLMYNFYLLTNKF